MAKRSREEWIQLAKKRIIKVLINRRVCCMRQLESKISEAGPATMRPEPIFITVAKDELIKERRIFKRYDTQLNCEFYFISNYNSNNADDKERYEYIKRLYAEFRSITGRQEWCGSNFERVIYKSIIDTKKYFCLKEPRQGQEIDGFVINNPLDFILHHKDSGIRVGVEAKNKREWLYGDTRDIWVMIKKCVEIEALPVIITRKIGYVARLYLFKPAGMLGFETHVQIFHPDASERLKEIRHVDGLGFASIRCSDSSDSRLMRFLEYTLPNQIQAYYDKFMNNLSLLKCYCDDLIEKEYARREIYRCFLNELHGRERSEPYDYYDYDDY